MIAKSKRQLIVIVPIIFIIFVLLVSYTSYFGNGENPFLKSVSYKAIIHQHSKEMHGSIKTPKGKTKKIPDMKAMSKNRSFSKGIIKMTAIPDAKTNIKNTKMKVKYHTKSQKRIIFHRKENNVKTEIGNCTKKEVKLSRTALPITGLVSFPGSGNTWTRHLIQQMTGLGTSSVYCDGWLRMRGFPHECQHDKSKTVVVKTHEMRHVKMFTKLVLLLRNPYDALLSYANFLKAGHTGHPPKHALVKASKNGFDHSLRWYVNLTRNVITKFKGPVHVIQYETLKTNMSHELRKLASFFNLNVTNKDIECTVKLQEGNFHRLTNERKHIELLRTVYSNEKLIRLREAARYSEKMIKDAYNIDIDLGGPSEKLLLKGGRKEIEKCGIDTIRQLKR